MRASTVFPFRGRPVCPYRSGSARARLLPRDGKHYCPGFLYLFLFGRGPDAYIVCWRARRCRGIERVETGRRFARRIVRNRANRFDGLRQRARRRHPSPSRIRPRGLIRAIGHRGRSGGQCRKRRFLRGARRRPRAAAGNGLEPVGHRERPRDPCGIFGREFGRCRRLSFAADQPPPGVSDRCGPGRKRRSGFHRGDGGRHRLLRGAFAIGPGRGAARMPCSFCWPPPSSCCGRLPDVAAAKKQNRPGHGKTHWAGYGPRAFWRYWRYPGMYLRPR